MLRFFPSLLLCLCLSFSLQAQIKNKQESFQAQKVIDPVYGITFYKSFVERLGGDSLRVIEGVTCSGRVTDYYSDGSVIHKGYYANGKLNDYKNFYPNGNVERTFKISDDRVSVLKVFYENGNPKSKVKYIDGESVEWEDFYPNGNTEYYEQYNKSREFFLAQRSYYEDGNPERLLEIEDRKKRLYELKEYHKNGKVQQQGEVIFNQITFDYQKKGKWEVYDKEGNLTKEMFYVHGQVNREVDHTPEP